VNVADAHFSRVDISDDKPAPRAIEALLTSFLSAALGLKLSSPLHAQPATHARVDPELHSFNDEANPRGWCAWETDRGAVRAYGEIDAAHSRGPGSLIVFIEWWLPPNIHHAGWWRCDTKRPQEWTKGRG
jgi:hypothetical protein